MSLRVSFLCAALVAAYAQSVDNQSDFDSIQEVPTITDILSDPEVPLTETIASEDGSYQSSERDLGLKKLRGRSSYGVYSAPLLQAAPVYQMAYAQPAPVYQQPVVQVYQAPAKQPVYQAPVYQAPAKQPVYQAPVYQAPAKQPVYQAPVYQAPAKQPVYQAPAKQPVYQAPAKQPVYQAQPVKAQPVYQAQPAKAQPVYQAPIDNKGRY